MNESSELCETSLCPTLFVLAPRLGFSGRAKPAAGDRGIVRGLAPMCRPILWGIGPRPMSTMTAKRPTVLLLTAGLFSLGASGPVTGCDALRSQIESRIRAAGVTQFLVTAVDVNAVVPGQIVGSCDRGRKKIVYLQFKKGSPQGAEAGPRPPAPTPAPAATPTRPGTSAQPAPAKSSAEPLLTECADGTVQRGGDCRK